MVKMTMKTKSMYAKAIHRGCVSSFVGPLHASMMELTMMQKRMKDSKRGSRQIFMHPRRNLFSVSRKPRETPSSFWRTSSSFWMRCALRSLRIATISIEPCLPSLVIEVLRSIEVDRARSRSRFLTTSRSTFSFSAIRSSCASVKKAPSPPAERPAESFSSFSSPSSPFLVRKGQKVLIALVREKSGGSPQLKSESMMAKNRLSTRKLPMMTTAKK
mmetsp:Transcript_16225/g.37600  ORF Transcript_16225/g.37600 Transcript_16225/m.37600 type:complete len:216 (-) Transcript_16225:905-1552(-)